MNTLLITTLLICLCLTGIVAGFHNMDPDTLSGFAKCQGLSGDELSEFFGQPESGGVK